MGNSRKSHVVETKGISFSGETKDWEKFRTELNNALEEKEMSWIICASKAIAKYFQGIVAERTADKSKQGNPMETDLAVLSDKKIKSVTTVMDKMGAKVSSK
jgi:methionyl-tRNA synthetase